MIQKIFIMQFSKSFHLVERLLEIMVCCYLFILMWITTVDVIGRYVFNSPLFGSTELTELTLTLTFFTTLPLLCLKNEHISVDLLEHFFHSKFKYIREIINQLLLILCIVAMSWGMYLLLLRAWRDELVSEILEIPTAYVLQYTLALLIVAVLSCAMFLISYLKKQ